MTNAAATQVRFLSVYRGEANYKVVNGPMDGRRVSVRHNGAEWYASTDASTGQDAHLSGMVTCYGAPVTADVLQAIQHEHDAVVCGTAPLWVGRWDEVSQSFQRASVSLADSTPPPKGEFCVDEPMQEYSSPEP